MAIEFENLSPQSFERMVQALCIHILGPGTIIFGAGPDGGREATFDGVVPFPSIADQWNGYIVVQAKFREQLRHTKQDANWLAEQLSNEFKKFLDRKRRLRKPEYYILASNVRLSSKTKEGGKVKVENVFKSHANKLGLKGYAVWGFDELRAFLENASGVRQTYTAWLTPGDVLHKLIEQLDNPSLTRLIPLAIARDLRSERDVRLRDAGQETITPIFLQDVFIDLPVTSTPIHGGVSGATDSSDGNDIAGPGLVSDSVSHTSESTPPDSRAGVVKQILKCAADKLDTEVPRGHVGPLPNRIVLLGGPGQGKSTIGQFIAQFTRARLLNAQSASKLNPATRDLIKPILQRAKNEDLLANGPCRFPARVDLPSFADAVARASESHQNLTLLSYLADRLSRDMDVAINASNLREWLGTCPWLLILDGLDEVPARGNRSAVLKAIEAFWDDVYLVNADVLCVVTTRPQGYNKDLDERYWQHWELAPLLPDEALKYGERLKDVRVSDPERGREIIDELKKALADPATKQLAISPLQVAILFGIALLKGSIPQDRWDLFARYYSLLRDREAQKPSSDAVFFRDFKRHIDALHHECGFLLQVRAEIAGNAACYLTPEEFERIATRSLADEGYGSDVLESVPRELKRIATQRLVLLSSRVEERISFDVRSLQEYMAAAYLTAAPQPLLNERLRAISNVAHWRHVFRIAASKIFSVADLAHLRNDILGICHGLDNGDYGEDDRTIRNGGRLALDLLLDGIGVSAPHFRKQLLRRALSLLDLGQNAFPLELGSIFFSELSEVFREEISSRLLQGETPAAFASWKLLLQLLHGHQSWAEPIVNQYWPDEPRLVMEVAELATPSVWRPTLLPKLRAAQVACGPARTIEYLSRNPPDEAPKLSGLPPIYHPHRQSAVAEASILKFGRTPRLSLSYIPIREAAKFQFSGAETLPTERWAAVRAAALFGSDPSKATLADAIGMLGSDSSVETAQQLNFPWPLSSLVKDAQEGIDPLKLAREASEGRFGDHTEWLAAETRWRNGGIIPSDVLTWNDGRYLSPRIAAVGAPYLRTLTRHHFTPVPQEVDLFVQSALQWVEAVKDVQSPLKQARLLGGLVFGVEKYDVPGFLDTILDLLQRLDSTLTHSLFEQAVVSTSSGMTRAAWRNSRFVEIADRVGRTLRDPPRVVEKDFDPIVAAFNEDPSKRGLLSFLASRSWGGDTRLTAAQCARLTSSAFDAFDGDEATVRVATALLRIACDRWDSITLKQLCDDLMAVPSYVSGYMLRLFIVRQRDEEFRSQRELLSALCSAFVCAKPLETQYLIPLLAAELDRRQTRLREPDECLRLSVSTLPASNSN